MKRSGLSPVLKVILLQILFLCLHFIYDWVPSGFTALISGTNESVYQHMKVAFFAYGLLAVVELALFYRRIESKARFIQTRGLMLSLFPLLLIPWYFTASAYFVKLTDTLQEVLFANVALLLVSITGVLIEAHLYKQSFGRAMQWITLILFLVTLSEFIIFNFRLPWLDVFANPPGW